MSPFEETAKRMEAAAFELREGHKAVPVKWDEALDLLTLAECLEKTARQVREGLRKGVIGWKLGLLTRRDAGLLLGSAKHPDGRVISDRLEKKRKSAREAAQCKHEQSIELSEKRKATFEKIRAELKAGTDLNMIFESYKVRPETLQLWRMVYCKKRSESPSEKGKIVGNDPLDRLIMGQ